MRLRALLDTGTLGLRLLSGEDELERSVRGVMTTDLRDPSRYLSGGELVLTGLAWRRGPGDTEPFVRLLAAAGVAGLAAGEAELGAVPHDLVEACRRHRMPLFAVDEQVAFATITEYVVRQVSGERAGDLAAVVDRHRRLMSAGPAGGGPDAVLDLLGSDLDLRAWVLSSTGREISGSGHRLPPAVRAELAGAQQAASRTGRPAPYRVTAQGGRVHSLFPVRAGGPGDVRATVLSDWFLAVEADAGEWPAERVDLLHGVTQLIAVERERRDAARAVRRRLAGEVFDLVGSGAPPAEIGARLRAAAPVLVPGATAAPQWQIVVARVEWADPAGTDPAEIGQAVLEEVLADPAATGADAAERIAVGRAEDRAMALVPLVPATPGGAGGTGGAAAGAAVRPLAAEQVQEALRGPLTRGLGDDGRLTIGVSAAVGSPEGLRGALEEARHARRVAAARTGRVCVAGHEELASHVLLLPFVPDDVRRAFTARLLDPLRAYDRRHRADLIPTLEAFLECDGSWTRCAARLHLHVNTLRYRIGRIEQLTGRDLSRLEDKLDFFLALRLT